MDGQGSYFKRLQFHRETANAFVSCRRFMPGVDGPTEALQERFLHDSIKATLSSHPLFSYVKQHFSGTRTNGCVQVQVPISKPDWYEIQDVMDMLGKINEGDIIQFCLECRLEDLKKRGIE